MASSFALCVPILTLLAYPVSDRFPLPKDFVPPNLTAMEGMGVPVVTWKSGKDETKIADLSVSGTDGIDTTMMSSLKHLIETCRNKTKQNLRVRSGYRSYNIQKILYERKGGETGGVAKPGSSEHQSGLAVDFSLRGRFLSSRDRAFKCLQAEGPEHGFINSYPRGNFYLDGKAIFEPWHWRFVGRDIALTMRDAGMLSKPREFLESMLAKSGCLKENTSAKITGSGATQ